MGWTCWIMKMEMKKSRRSFSGGGGAPSSLFLIVSILLITYQFNLVCGCPLVCICKWKGGKQTVECKNQGLETLPDGIDPETQVLDISGNKLGFLPKDAFQRAGLLNLQKIHIRNSRLTHIDPGAFSELINLVEIELSDNLLTSVPSQAFRTTPFVRDLNLAGNPIARLKDASFQHVSQLVKLDLSRCQLVHIEDQAFAHLQILETLKLNSNNLTLLNNATVKSLSQLHGIELQDNPWECDCRLRDLKLWIERRNIPHPISPTCHSPPRLQERKFSELPVSEFACPPRLVETGSGGREVVVIEGEDARFRCIFDATPTPVVRWYSNGRLIPNNTLISLHRKLQIFQEDSESTLLLTNTLGKDAGDYFCVVQTPAGSVEANFTLEILPQPPFQNILDTSHVLVLVLAICTILILLAVAIGAFIYWRWRLNKPGCRKPSKNQQEILATSTPVKPPRLNYEINPGSLVANGFKPKGESATDNPDLILETNNGSTYQDIGVEDESSNSELNWEQQSYRNLGYSTEYPPDYGLPIIHENSVYSDSSYYGQIGPSVSSTPGVTFPHPPNGVTYSNPPNGVVSANISALWNNKNKVGQRITAPNARDSPDEGYQEGYVGTDV